MKTRRLFAAIAALTLIVHSSSAQSKCGKCEWQERMQSEKIAFLTAELDLTPEEAQTFWPVYNQIEQKKHQSQMAVMTSYKELLEALKAENSSDKEIDRLLDNYLAAKHDAKEAGKDDIEQYRKILPGKKVAKLYVAEEKFRRHHIRSMKGGPQGGKPGAKK